MSLPPTSAPQDPSTNYTTSGARRSHPGLRNSSIDQPTSRRGPTPISTASSTQLRPPSTSESPSRTAFSPTTSHFASASIAPNRQLPSRHSSISSTASFTSPPGSGHATGSLHSGGRSRAVTASGSPRLATSHTSLSSTSQGGGSAGGGASRLARHSPSLSLTNNSPVSPPAGPHSASGSGPLHSLVSTQLNILLSTLREDKDRAKWETQTEKIRKLVDDNGMEVFTTYFRRLLQSNASTIFPGAPRAPAGIENAGSYQLLVEEMQKILKDPLQAERIAQALDTSDSDLFRDFDLSTFVDHFRLDAIAKIALVLPCRSVSKPDLRSKGESAPHWKDHSYWRKAVIIH